MDDSHSANRRFEIVFPDLAYQEHLRCTDPERYRQHMETIRSQPVNPEDSELVAIVVYDSKNKKVRFEQSEDGNK